MYNQGAPFVVPLWGFILAVCFPIIGAVIAEILIYLKDYRSKDY